MNIGIVLDKLYPGKIGGAEQYVRNIISVWKDEKDINLLLFLNEQAMDSFAYIENDNIRRIKVFDNMDNAESYYEYYISRFKIQVLFCPLFYVPYYNCSVPIVTSVHDIQYEYFPQYFSKELLDYRRRETLNAVTVSSAVITMSEYSKQTIVDKLKVDSDRIYVTYENSDKTFEEMIDDSKNVEIRNTLPDSYIFYPANGWEHKNHINLVKAFRILKERYGTECKLVFTGNAFNGSKLRQEIKNQNLEDDVIVLGYVPQEDMPYIFANAKMLVFPSLFEGFGIPLVEAMRVGTPIACSDCGSIPEVAGDAALVFDAYNPDDIADKIHMLDTDTILRDKLVENGRQRAKIFSWKKCAEETLKVLEQYKADILNVKQIPKVYLNIVNGKDDNMLRETLESIKRLNYPSLSYQVVDDIVHISSKTDSICGTIFAGQEFKSDESFEQIVANVNTKRTNVCTMVAIDRGDFWGYFIKNERFCEKYARYVIEDKISIGNSFWYSASTKLPVFDRIVILDNNSMTDNRTIEDGIYKRKLLKSLFQGDSIRTEYYKQIIKHGIKFDDICSDGWISDECSIRFMANGDFKCIYIKGENNIFRRNNNIKLYLNDRCVYDLPIGKNGEFDVNVELPNVVQSGEYTLKLKLKHAKSLYISGGNDIRCVSVRILCIKAGNDIIFEA